jgi:hypothetical protein
VTLFNSELDTTQKYEKLYSVDLRLRRANGTSKTAAGGGSNAYVILMLIHFG